MESNISLEDSFILWCLKTELLKCYVLGQQPAWSAGQEERLTVAWVTVDSRQAALSFTGPLTLVHFQFLSECPF